MFESKGLQLLTPGSKLRVCLNGFTPNKSSIQVGGAAVGGCKMSPLRPVLPGGLFRSAAEPFSV